VSYYLRQYPVQSGLYTEVWKIDHNTAFRLGVTNPPTFTQDEGKTIWETLALSISIELGPHLSCATRH
jgi:hypothetical protein